MNVALGGGLFQHVPDTLGNPCDEEHNRGPAYDASHSLTVVSSTCLGAALAGVDRVNSAHHQAIDPARLGRGLRIAALSALGIVEAVELDGTGARVCAVQWHPERLPCDDPASLRLISRLRAEPGWTVVDSRPLHLDPVECPVQP
jgi:putative glutamine amidotransferase